MPKRPTYRPSAVRVGKSGIAGSAVLFGTAGLYLVYVGVRDVPFFEGLRSLLRKERPIPTSDHERFQLLNVAGQVIGRTAVEAIGSDTGIEQLEGSAALAYPFLKKRFPDLKMGGWRAQGSVANSDHPKGKAIDVMTSHPVVANDVIKFFKKLPGAKYYIWNRKIAQLSGLWVEKPYTGPSPHLDHVHLSFY